MAKKSPQVIKTEHPLTLVYEIPIGRTAVFWDKLREGKVVAPRCRKCGTIYFPPQTDCINCLTSEMDWIELRGDGTLETYTHVMVAPSSFMKQIPYTVAVGKLPEGVRVLAWLSGVEYDKIKLGMKLRLAAKQVGEGKFRYEWTPVA